MMIATGGQTVNAALAEAAVVGDSSGGSTQQPFQWSGMRATEITEVVSRLSTSIQSTFSNFLLR